MCNFVGVAPHYGIFYSQVVRKVPSEQLLTDNTQSENSVCFQIFTRFSGWSLVP